MAISFHKQETTFSFKKIRLHKKWILECLRTYATEAGDLNFIFTSNQEIREINRAYLKHDYFTDVITFDYSEGKSISGDIFISIEEVSRNSEYYQVPLYEELRRVIIHGVLHLMGYKDNTEKEREMMRKQEDLALVMWMKMEKNEFKL